MNPVALLHHHYPPGSVAHRILADHSARVAALAAAVAKRLHRRGEKVDVEFVRQAAWLHDIGILHTAAPDLGCSGSLPYICHGIKGREMLEGLGLPRHALVCERHIGVGLTAHDIHQQRLPLPAREMVPLSLEERIVAYADLFFSKHPQRRGTPRGLEDVRRTLARHGDDKVAVFDLWHRQFSE